MALSTGYGTTLWRKASDGSLTKIGGVSTITPPSSETEEAEVKELDGDGFKKSLPGLTNPGEVQVVLNFDPENEGHTQLIADRDAKTVNDYRITLPGASFGWDFKAWVKKYEVGELDGSTVIQATVTLRVTGPSTPGPITP